MVKKYNIDPARGQAILNFQGRIMPTSIKLYETEVIEKIKNEKNDLGLEKKEEELNPDFKNLVMHGDCLSTCAYLKNKNIKLDLVYIDPPFASGANYAKKIQLRNADKNAIKSEDNSIGEEIMYGDIWQKEDYLNWLYERLLAIRDVMSDSASIYLHLDWHIGHYAKVMMDEIFGEENFINEIIWAYRSGGASKKASISRKHDIILFYSKNNNFEINTIKERQYLDKAFMDAKQDEKGRYYSDTILRDFLMDGIFTRVLDNSKIKEYNTRPVLNLSSEQANYATQKPEGLLELLMDVASNEGMIVADFFSGSGTTARVAHKLGRKFITSDVGINAIQTTRDGLVEKGASFNVLKIKDGLRLFRNPAQTVNIMFDSVAGFKSRQELELSDFWAGGIANESGSSSPLHFVGIDKKLTRVLLDVILEEIARLEDNNNEIIILYAHKDIDINQELVKKESSKKILENIKLISLDDFLGENATAMFMPDNADISVTKEGDKYKIKINKFFSPYLKKKVDDFNAKSTILKPKHITISDNGLELIESVQFDTTLEDVWRSNIEIEDKAKLKQQIKGEYLLNTNKFKMKIRNISGDEIIIEHLNL